jgi:hypothetical protein
MAKKQTLRDYTRGTPSEEDTKYFNAAMDAPSDMASAILQAIQLEHALETSIIIRLNRRDEETLELLSKDNGALGTFFSKIGLAYAMGVYDANDMEYFNVIRRIRNAFAHSRKRISFATPLIRQEIHSIKLPKDPWLRDYLEIAKRVTGPDVPEHVSGSKDMDNTLALTGRAGYTLLCMPMLTYLLREQTNFVIQSRGLSSPR